MLNYYVYIYLDPRKPGNYKYGEIEFDHEPFYVGKGSCNRCYNGLKDRKKSLKTNKIKSIENDGGCVIIEKIYSNLSESDAFRLEISTIEKIGRIDNGTGILTNMTSGGDGTSGRVYTEKEKNRKRNFKHVQEWLTKISIPILKVNTNGDLLKEYRSIKEASLETGIAKQNISAVLNNRRKTAGGFIWEYKNKLDKLQGHLKKPNIMPKHSDETKEKMRKSAKIGKNHPMFGVKEGNHPSSKKIVQRDQEGNIIKIWDSIQSISNELGFTPSNICRCCKGTVKRIGGYKWEYYN